MKRGDGGVLGRSIRGAKTEPPAARWRFDFPEVPARVTAVEDRVGWIWVRDGDGWRLWRDFLGAGPYRIYDGDLMARAPLVECEDPRPAS